MLKIVDAARSNGSWVLRLEGRLIDRWVAEVRRAAAAAPDGVRGLVIDLGGVSFVDVEGVALLRQLAQAGAHLSNGSPFVNDQLNAAAGTE